PHIRRVFRASALLLGVGRPRSRKPAGKAAQSLLGSMPVPPGWTDTDWQLVGWTIRYHRGKQPKPKQRRYSALPDHEKHVVETLAGVLRLARALRQSGVESLRGMRAEMTSEAILLRVPGWVSTLENESSVAKGKHLLERAVGRQILLLPLEKSQTLTLPVAGGQAQAAASD